MFSQRILLTASVLFSLLTTSLLVLQLLQIFPFGTPTSISPQRGFLAAVDLVLVALQSRSIVLAPLGWGAVVGIWIWRGRTKSQWVRQGLDKQSFKLVLQMRGAPTRTMILKMLATPKDRFQISRELHLNWATVDYHVRVLRKHDLITEKIAYGSVKMYELTQAGSALLRALEQMKNGKDAEAPKKG